RSCPTTRTTTIRRTGSSATSRSSRRCDPLHSPCLRVESALPKEARMRMTRCVLGLFLAMLVSDGGMAHAQSFYEGKTIRLLVGFAPGGGFDTYARAIGRHLGKHVPGQPSIIVENMPGAGSLIATNHLFRVAKPDGLTLAHFNGVLFLGQVLGQP